MKFKRKTILTLAWALLLAPVLVLFLVACSPVPPKPERDTIFTSVTLVDGFDNPDQIGRIKHHGNGVCAIEIKRDHYPDCITHEVLHCFSGSWHEGDNDDFCYTH